MKKFCVVLAVCAMILGCGRTGDPICGDRFHGSYRSVRADSVPSRAYKLLIVSPSGIGETMPVLVPDRSIDFKLLVVRPEGAFPFVPFR